MCHTTHTTHLPCDHTLTSHTPCVAASGYLHSTFLSVLLSPPKCNRIRDSITLHSLCALCTEFWRERGIGDEEARERLEGWRRRNAWWGGARPVEGEGRGFVTFERDGGEGGKGEGKSEEKGDEEMLGGMERKVDGVRSRRNSTSSTCTLWPGAVSGEVETEVEVEREVGQDGTASGEGVERFKLGSDGVGAKGGEEIEECVRLPGLMADDELVHPDAFELSDLEEELPEVTVDGFDQQELSMSPRPFPTEGLQRMGEGRKLC